MEKNKRGEQTVALRDHRSHRRLSLKIALKTSPLSFEEMCMVPVYQYLAEQVGAAAVKATVRQDLEKLRANGEQIDVSVRARDGASVYRLRDDSNIHLEASGLNLNLLMPLLDTKPDTTTGAYARMGVNKTLATAHGGKQHHYGLNVAIPSGPFVVNVALAVQHRYVLEVNYQSVNDTAPAPRLIAPRALEIHAGTFYVRALKLDINTHEPVGERLYKLDRMTSCVRAQVEIRNNWWQQGEDYGTPAAGLARDYHREFFTPVEAVIQVQPGAAEPIVTRAQAVPGKPNHYVLREVGVRALFDDLALYGPHAVLISPENLVAQIAQRAHHLATTMRKTTLPGKADALDVACTSTPQPSTARPPLNTPTVASSREKGTVVEEKGQVEKQADAARIEHCAESPDRNLSRRESYVTYLLTHGRMRLSKLAKHFSVTPEKAWREVQDLFTTELLINGHYASPYDFDMPQWQQGEPIDPSWEIEALTNPEFIEFSQTEISLTLAEVIAMLSAVDSLLTVAAGENAYELEQLRSRLVRATTDAGYGSALWPAPSARSSRTIMQELADAVEGFCEISITYWSFAPVTAVTPTTQNDITGAQQLGAQQSWAQSAECTVQPFAIDPQLNPLLAAVNENGDVRTFRLDRISAVKPTGKRVSKTAARTWRRSYASRSRTIDGTPIELMVTRRARWVFEELPGAELVSSPDGSTLTIRARVHNIQWLRGLLLHVGEDFIALKPDSVASALQPALDELSNLYNTGLDYAQGKETDS